MNRFLLLLCLFCGMPSRLLRSMSVSYQRVVVEVEK